MLKCRKLRGYYPGSFKPDSSPNTALVCVLQDITQGFVGCMRSYMLADQEFGDPDRQYHTQPCSGDAESGAFFYHDGGYLILSK